MTGPEGNSEFCFPRISMFHSPNWKLILTRSFFFRISPLSLLDLKKIEFELALQTSDSQILLALD